MNEQQLLDLIKEEFAALETRIIQQLETRLIHQIERIVKENQQEIIKKIEEEKEALMNLLVKNYKELKDIVSISLLAISQSKDINEETKKMVEELLEHYNRFSEKAISSKDEDALEKLEEINGMLTEMMKQIQKVKELEIEGFNKTLEGISRNNSWLKNLPVYTAELRDLPKYVSEIKNRIAIAEEYIRKDVKKSKDDIVRVVRPSW